jgi:rod shape-determining protein MreD
MEPGERRVGMLSIMVPVATLVLATLISVLPWGIGSDVRYLLPVVPFLVAYFWSRHEGSRIPSVLVFAAGLTVDVLTAGPLGFWPLLYLTGLALADLVERLAGRLRGLAEWLALGIVLEVLAVLAWLVLSAYSGGPAEIRPFVLAAGVVFLAWPPLALVLGGLSGGLERPRILNLQRRG